MESMTVLTQPARLYYAVTRTLTLLLSFTRSRTSASMINLWIAAVHHHTSRRHLVGWLQHLDTQTVAQITSLSYTALTHTRNSTRVLWSLPLIQKIESVDIAE